jgi:hypothetical protein
MRDYLNESDDSPEMLVYQLDKHLREIAAKLLITADELESGACHPAKAANRLRKIVRENLGFADTAKAATYLPHGMAGTLKSCDPPVELGGYVGCTEDAAKELASQRGFTYRVRKRDGKVFMGTADYRADRVDFVVENGIVTEVHWG